MFVLLVAAKLACFNSSFVEWRLQSFVDLLEKHSQRSFKYGDAVSSLNL